MCKRAGFRKDQTTSPMYFDMLPKTAFNEALKDRGTLIIDGALATELETRGHDLSHALWSGKTLKESPESIQEVHLDYYLAGADIAITASYQASVQSFREHFGCSEDEATDLIQQSVRLAQAARQEAHAIGMRSSRKLLVAGSVGPYGAYLADGSEYRGDYKLSLEEFQAFHRPRIEALTAASVDLLALETIPSYAEIKALLQLLRTDFPSTVAWLSCTLSDSTHISDGTPIEEVLRLLDYNRDHIVAFGINCVPPDLAVASLKHMQGITDIPLLCYPNSGETYVAKDHAWIGDKSANVMRDQALLWSEAGAKLLGGCCRTTPEDIRHMADAFGQTKK